MDTSENLDPKFARGARRRLVRQIAFCDPQIREVGSRKQFSCQPTEARGF